jgi:hypothetical protein
MTSFLQTAKGGIQPINGRAGSLVENLNQANQGTPGKDVIVNVVNQIIAATQVNMPVNVCDPQAALQRTQQRVQQQVQQILENYIIQEVKNELAVSAPVLDLQKQLQNLQLQPQTESINQQIEIVEKEMQNNVRNAIVGVVGRAATQLPQVTKVANSTAAGLKTVSSVAESLATFVPSQGINMSAYGGAGQKTIQTVSQACWI